MSQSYPDPPVATETAGGLAAARDQLRTLWHHQPDYDYRPDLFQYTEFYTTDPDYVVAEISIMSPGREHANILVQLKSALDILTRSHTPPVHVSMKVDIKGIPAGMLASERHTSALRPDLTVWAGAPPPTPHLSYL